MSALKVQHINCGSMVFGTVSHCLLIETDDTLVLVDTGFGTPCVRDPATFLGPARLAIGADLDEGMTAIRQIESAGHDPRDVRNVVLTHLDLDHAGGLADFPWATVHVHGPELRSAQTPSLGDRVRYRPQQWQHGPRWEVNETDSGERWFGFDAVRDLPGLPPEILVVPLYGHTHGHAGVAVDTGSGWLLHAGDAFFTANQLAHRFHPMTPIFGSPGARLARARLDNVRRLRELNDAHADQITIFSAHDKHAFHRLASR